LLGGSVITQARESMAGDGGWWHISSGRQGAESRTRAQTFIYSGYEQQLRNIIRTQKNCSRALVCSIFGVPTPGDSILVHRVAGVNAANARHD